MEENLVRLIKLMNRLVFPDIYLGDNPDRDTLSVKAILVGLADRQKADAFEERIPEISRLLHTDVAAVMHNDPAVTSREEVILCYPAIKEMVHYRTAHELLKLGIPTVPRMLTEMAHSETGIDIHPAAEIGEYFAIDHGTGIVVGATSIIGNHVMLYQGVTLGAKNFRYDADGNPINEPRHPILEDNVTVYSNTSILGRVRIGHDTIIGGNIWLTHDVPPHSKILQSHAIQEPLFDAGAGI
jgi:serine O-acetyltransferase